ncbi:cold-shock protein [Clostridium sp. HBUAS56010]|uniref:cold-shock protein n=1 Tax=Clostridium sp. HBUAS56010 TaxID=2571127 RepID=UPI001177CBE0|nr:cold-shock protein [Clostridium sp. HBUAS56010]
MDSGIVKWFNAMKGFGFITREDGTDLFVHHSDLNITGYRTLNEGQRVEFNSVTTKKGNQAVNVFCWEFAPQ